MSPERCRLHRRDGVGAGDGVVRGHDRGHAVSRDRGRAGREARRNARRRNSKRYRAAGHGSIGLLAVMTTASGLAKAVPVGRLLGGTAGDRCES